MKKCKKLGKGELAVLVLKVAMPSIMSDALHPPEHVIYKTLAELRKILEEIKSPKNYSEDEIGNINAPKEFWVWLKKEHPEVWETINSEPSSALAEYFEWLAEKALILLGDGK